MSDSVLRSVSPIHVQYLKNMGVSASASVSIVVQGELWGLIAFHHLEPKLLGYELREACKHLAQVLAQHIRARESSQARDQTAELAARRDELAKELSKTESLDPELLAQCALVAQLVPCDGAAVLCGDRLATAGVAPPAKTTRALADWVIDSNLPYPFATAHLSGCPGYPLEPLEEAAGLLASVVSAEDRVALLWLRAEQIKQVEWAGNPHKPTEPGEESGRLNPRKSFAVWAEIVRNRSHPWSKAEEDTARRFSRLVEGLRQQETLRRLVARNEQLLAQKDLLMQEADHRIQNNIQLIHSMLGLQAREIPNQALRAQIEETQRRLMAVSMMHRQLWRSGELHGVDLGKYLTELRDGLVASWGAGWSEHLKINAASIIIPANRAVTLALVVNEVLTNAVKYAYEGRQGPIEIDLTEQDGDGLRIDIADRGVGWKDDGTQGFGSRLTRSLMSQLQGDIEITSNGPGTRVILRAKRSESNEGERPRK